jgi:RNA polymerase sigma-70 factor (ECF subfamily)
MGDPIRPDGDDPTPARVAELCARIASSPPPGTPADAVEELLYLHHARLLGFARRKIGPDFAGKLEPEDLVQEAYAEVFRTIAKFEPRVDDAFYHWVTRIIEQRFIDAVRALRRRKRDIAREQTTGVAGENQSRRWTLCEQLGADLPRPSQTARRDEALAAMMACIARLPPDDRLIVERLHLRGEHPADIGHDTGRSEDAVRRLAGRALERLRALMGRASRYTSRS